jgi:histidinol-phosphate aminotransferase
MTYPRPAPTTGALRLHMNENTAGCSPAVLAAIHAVTAGEAARYPDYGEATARCARWFGVPAEWVQLTNGLDEGLHVVAQSRRPTFDAIVIEPAFEMYAIGVESAGGRVVTIPPRPDFAFPTEEVLRAISPDVRVIYLTDPNNPTGLAIPAGVVERIAAAVPRALVVVDEAYADFSGRTSIPLLDRWRNLIVGRTFAKAHGLAGLRIGALVAHPDTLAPLQRVLPPYTVNVCALRALGAALEDEAFLRERVAESVASKTLVYDFCRRLGLDCWPSESNFVLVRIGPRAPDAVRALEAHGIVIRDRSTQPGCAGCVRFTAGVVAHTSRCLAALEDALASRGD